MCNVQEDDTGLPEPKPTPSVGRVCMKCQEEKALLITRVNDAFCRTCFMVYVTHKFRASIGKSHLIRDGEKILLAFSGGPSSSALLHLILEGLSVRAHKRLRFIPSVIYVDECGSLDMSTSERNEINERVLSCLRACGFPAYISTLEQGLEFEKTDTNGTSVPLCWNIQDENEFENYEHTKQSGRLQEAMASIKSVTTKDEFIRNVRNQLMAAIALQRGYSKLMFADNSTRLSIRILSDIGQGRGSQVPSDTHFADNRNPDMLFVRPLRDLTSKEIAMYNCLNGVEPVIVPTLTTKAVDSSSIEHLTETFVMGLQAEFPSTVSNIIRTGGKLESTERQSTEDFCVFCQSSLDTNVSEASALRAVEFSEKLSKKGCGTEGSTCTEDKCCDKGDVSCQSYKTDKLSRDDMFLSLCYGCRLIVKDMSDTSTLPKQVITDSRARLNRLKMKETIKVFLLEPGSGEG